MNNSIVYYRNDFRLNCLFKCFDINHFILYTHTESNLFCISSKKSCCLHHLSQTFFYFSTQKYLCQLPLYRSWRNCTLKEIIVIDWSGGFPGGGGDYQTSIVIPYILYLLTRGKIVLAKYFWFLYTGRKVKTLGKIISRNSCHFFLFY